MGISPAQIYVEDVSHSSANREKLAHHSFPFLFLQKVLPSRSLTVPMAGGAWLQPG
jgi:hypothetical protein